MAKRDSEKTQVPKEHKFQGMPAKITAILEKESDRGAILVLAAYLEEVLGLIVRAACVTDEDADKILEFRAPAGGFDLKIQLCKATALIHSAEVDGLQAVRRIRNAAAHFDKDHGFDTLFDSDSTISLVENVAKSQNVKMESRAPKDVRTLFILCVRLLAAKLYVRLLETERPKRPSTVKEMANGIREQMKNTDWGRKLAAAEADAQKSDPEKLYQYIKSTGEILALIVNKQK